MMLQPRWRSRRFRGVYVAQKVKPKRQILANEKKILRYLIAFPLIALAIKFIVMFNIPSGGWLGADGENYTSGVNGLLREGFYSKEPKLSYWPAGYPLLLWPLAKISISNFYYLVSIIQTIFFAYGTYYFTSQVNKSAFKKFTLLASFLISFNPTLSLSTLVVGYEAPIAACFMMISGLLIKNFAKDIDRKFWLAVAAIAGWFSLAIFMQPRFLLVGLLFFAYWGIKLGSKKYGAALLVLIALIMAIAPAIMIVRNIEVINQATISTNLGVTMAIGAGDQTKGGYDRTGPEVPCKPKLPETVVTDSNKVKCVIQWYLQNPVKTVNLAFNKTQFFWSPWSGPLVNGTMARNPWLKISPTESIGKTQDGAKIITGFFGKIISYGWIVGQMFFLFLGFKELRKFGQSEKIFANLLLLPIVISWLISIGTIGDHRFRIPTMALSLFLQTAGFLALKAKIVRAL
jgi:hypothetical protein